MNTFEGEVVIGGKEFFIQKVYTNYPTTIKILKRSLSMYGVKENDFFAESQSELFCYYRGVLMDDTKVQKLVEGDSKSVNTMRELVVSIVDSRCSNFFIKGKLVARSTTGGGWIYWILSFFLERFSNESFSQWYKIEYDPNVLDEELAYTLLLDSVSLVI
jgi:hypothetical protein